jgi:TonB family protein
MQRFTRCIAVTLTAAIASFAQAQDNDPTKCDGPLAYPREASKLGEAGISLVGFLVRTDGTVDRSVVLGSSGSRELDQATRQGLSKCRFEPLKRNGQAIEAWQPVNYVWRRVDDPGMVQAKRDAAADAKKGNAEAYFHLSRLLMNATPTQVDRQRALTLLRTAAERGQPHAQYQLGTRYEKGIGVDEDAAQAQQWYEKAAAQGDEFALQRLRLGEIVTGLP